MERSFEVLSSKRFRRLFKEGFWVLLGQAAVVVGMLISVRILTALLNPTAYGELALGMTLATLVNQVLLGPLSNGVSRFYAPAVENGELGNYLLAVRQLVLYAVGIVILMSPIIISGLAIFGQSKWIVLAGISLIYAVVRGVNFILNGLQNAARQRAIVALHQGAEPWARFSIAAGLIVWFGATSIVAMVGYVISIVLVLVSQYLIFLKIVPQVEAFDSNIKEWRDKICQYSWPFLTWGIFAWSQQVSDRWALRSFGTTYEVGLYAVLFQMGSFPISTGSRLLVQFLTPIFYQRAGDASDIQRNNNVSNLSLRLTGLVLVGTLVIFFGAFIFHKKIFHIFVDIQYDTVSYLLPWVFLSAGLFAAGQTLSINLQSQMKTQSMIIVKITTAILGVIFNFAGAFYWGIQGIILSGVLFSVVYLGWMFIIFKRTESG